MAVVDFFDALTMDRCYRPAYDDEVALEMLGRGRPVFDPERSWATFLANAPGLIGLRDWVNLTQPSFCADGRPRDRAACTHCAMLQTDARPAARAPPITSAKETCDEHADVAVSFPFAMAVLAWAWLANRHLQAIGPVADRVQRAQEMRVCIWTDYYGISARNAHRPALGIDDLSAALASDLSWD